MIGDTDTGADRGDWSLMLWVPVVFAVAGVRGVVRRVRHALCGAAYRAAEALNDAPPPPSALTGDGALWRAEGGGLRFTRSGHPCCPECSTAMLRNTLDPGGFVCNYCGHSLVMGEVGP